MAAAAAVAFCTTVADGEIGGAVAATTAVAFRVTVADGEIDGTDATLLVIFSAAMLGDAVAEFEIAETLGDT